MSLPLYIHGSTDVGRQRAQNEDAFRIVAQPDGSRLLVVCDGMGGHEAGEVASLVATERIVEVLATSSPDHPPRALYQMFMEANRAVLDAAVTRGSVGMGTTGVVAWVLGTRCYVGWVGDSRLYQFREGLPVERTRDHTRVAHLVSQGVVKPEEASQHPEAHILTRALGGSPGVQKGFKPEVWSEPLELRAGDVVLLCSDGLYDFIDDPELYPLIEGRDYQEAVARLIQTANERGGADNITVILLVAGQPEVPRQAEAPPRTARRETLPDGMPGVPVPEPLTERRTQTPLSFPVRPHVPAATLAVASLPTEKSERRVPLWLLFITGLIALGIGLAVGFGVGGGEEPVPQVLPLPLPLPESSPSGTP